MYIHIRLYSPDVCWVQRLPMELQEPEAIALLVNLAADEAWLRCVVDPVDAAWHGSMSVDVGWNVRRQRV